MLKNTRIYTSMLSLPESDRIKVATWSFSIRYNPKNKYKYKYIHELGVYEFIFLNLNAESECSNLYYTIACNAEQATQITAYLDTCASQVVSKSGYIRPDDIPNKDSNNANVGPSIPAEFLHMYC
jgi:hypothetical protein